MKLVERKCPSIRSLKQIRQKTRGRKAKLLKKDQTKKDRSDLYSEGRLTNFCDTSATVAYSNIAYSYIRATTSKNPKVLHNGCNFHRDYASHSVLTPQQLVLIPQLSFRSSFHIAQARNF